MNGEARARELRRLLAGTGLLALLLALAWSPLPETLLGSRLEAGNARRPATGRAHERAGLADAGRENAGELGRDAESRRRAAAEAVSLPSLARLLERYGELTLSRGEFLEFYASLDGAQREAFADPVRLWGWVEEDGLQEAHFALEDGGGRYLLASWLDGRRNRLAERRVDLDGLRFGALGFARLAEDDSLLVPADPGLVAWSAPEWLALRAGGAPPAGLAELLLLPGVRVARLYEDGRGGLWVDVERGGRHLLLERIAGAETEPAPESAPADSARTEENPEGRTRRWFGF